METQSSAERNPVRYEEVPGGVHLGVLVEEGGHQMHRLEEAERLLELAQLGAHTDLERGIGRHEPHLIQEEEVYLARIPELGEDHASAEESS